MRQSDRTFAPFASGQLTTSTHLEHACHNAQSLHISQTRQELQSVGSNRERQECRRNCGKVDARFLQDILRCERFERRGRTRLLVADTALEASQDGGPDLGEKQIIRLDRSKCGFAGDVEKRFSQAGPIPIRVDERQMRDVLDLDNCAEC